MMIYKNVGLLKNSTNMVESKTFEVFLKQICGLVKKHIIFCEGSNTFDHLHDLVVKTKYCQDNFFDFLCDSCIQYSHLCVSTAYDNKFDIHHHFKLQLEECRVFYRILHTFAYFDKIGTQQILALLKELFWNTTTWVKYFDGIQPMRKRVLLSNYIRDVIADKVENEIHALETKYTCVYYQCVLNQLETKCNRDVIRYTKSFLF